VNHFQIKNRRRLANSHATDIIDRVLTIAHRHSYGGIHMLRTITTLAASFLLMTSLFAGKSAKADDPHGSFDSGNPSAAAHGGWGDGTNSNHNFIFAWIFFL
jgi:hypothetical protein